jgi:hypothetical protein
VLLAVLGGSICLVGDHLHATMGVLYYSHPVVWAQAWWVWPLFAGATLLAVFGAGTTRRVFGAAPLDSRPREVLSDAIAFMTAYAFTSFGHQRPTVVLLVLLAFWAARAITLPGWVAAYSVVAMIGGCAFEATLSSTGAFTYYHPDWGGVPRWLPGIYAFVGIVAARLEAT